jgi:hypothetical protein
MKTIFRTLFFCLCLIQIALAQNIPFNPNALVILDGVPYHQDVSKINPNDIEDVYVLKAEKAVELYGSAGKNGAILILTKQCMIATVKKRLSMFSKEYKEYIESNSDDNITYTLDGGILKRNSLGVAIILFKIPPEQIKEVRFTQEKNSSDSTTVTVNIATKK